MRLRALAFPVFTAVLLVSACPAAPAEPAPAPASMRGAKVRGDLDELVRSGAVGALATLTDAGGDTVLTAGAADLASGTPVRADVPEYVRVGSITKTFTATIVLQLAAEHRIDLDQPIDTYLPGLLIGEGIDGRAITVGHILGHRSGLPEPAASPETSEYQAALSGRTYTPAQEIAIALRSPARFAPGTGFAYSNINYIVAGMLIEKVTGRAYSDELQARILTPLALSHTYLPATGETGLRTPHLTGYSSIDGVRTDTTRMEPSLPWTSGALVSTGADLNRFYTALTAGDLLPRSELHRMLDGVDMGNGDGMFYGLGVGYTELPCGTKFVGHVGGVEGFTAVSGAAAGRAVTYSFTGSPRTADIGGLLTHALCD
ncbi:serine hydrolase domain-containing protein [Nocardia inohanensis]|uniref:serine hydrolase domain-containing protein n=1 Tax=Nocardia inohanensis TaxID=209246 RepID=UPI001FDF8B0B|nr:serine hydrolase domain-containing protein [Nocardia inohanensis]